MNSHQRRKARRHRARVFLLLDARMEAFKRAHNTQEFADWLVPRRSRLWPGVDLPRDAFVQPVRSA